MRPLSAIRRYLSALSGNSRVLLLFHPMWAIPYSLYTYFLSLYLKASGVTDAGLGTLMVAASAVSFALSLLTAPLVDRMGRKRATFVFDLISAAAPPLVYFLSGSFPFALLATALSNANKIVGVSYYLLLLEDAGEKESVVALNVFNLITAAAGLLLPLAGLVVGSLGLVAGERLFLLFATACMTGMIFWRNRLAKETSVGLRLLEQRRAWGRRALLQPYAEALRYVRAHPAALYFTLCNVFFYAYMNLGTNTSLYFVPYFVDRLGMDALQSAVLGSVYNAGMIGAMLLINPLLLRRGVFPGLYASAALGLIGLCGLVIIPRGSLPLAVACVLLTAMGFGMMKTSVEGGLALSTQGDARSGIYALCNLVSAAVGLLAAALCGWLYPIFAGWVYVLCAGAVGCVLGFGWLAGRRGSP